MLLTVNVNFLHHPGHFLHANWVTFHPSQIERSVGKVKSTRNPIGIHQAFVIPHGSLPITKMDEQSTSAH
jgi:hypothetical protein